MPSLPPQTLSPERRGSAAAVVLLLLVVLAAFVGYLWLSPTSAPAGGGSVPVVSTPAGSRTPRSSSAPRLETQAATAPVAELPAGRTPSPTDTQRFQGRGSLRGSVDTSTGQAFPATWTLVLEPSASLRGPEPATSQRLEFDGDQREFELPDLPLAGYAVRAEAEGYNGLAVHVVLEKTSPSAYVMLQISPAGFLTGRLDGSDGGPLEGIDVWLFDGKPPPLGLTGSGGRQTTSLADGTWRFDAVLDGPHTLLFGRPLAPLAGPLEINFRAPSLTVPSPEFPPMAAIEILVVDDSQQPVNGARLWGSGAHASSFDLETPPNGRVRLEHLLPGHYSFDASHELFGSGHLERRFEGGEDETQLLVLMRRP